MGPCSLQAADQGGDGGGHPSEVEVSLREVVGIIFATGILGEPLPWNLEANPKRMEGKGMASPVVTVDEVRAGEEHNREKVRRTSGRKQQPCSFVREGL
jgi:hypothetical protein